MKEKEFIKHKKLLAEDAKKRLDNRSQIKKELKENFQSGKFR